MQIPRAFCILTLSVLTSKIPAEVSSGATQAAAPAASAGAPAEVAPAVKPSSLLRPALSQAEATLNGLKIDKWKKGSVRDEAGSNVSALLHDLQSNIPPLVTAADAEPGSLSHALPLVKHLDAFYDVLLRVEEASRVSAPGEQVNALQQTLLDVNKARIALDDQLQAQAAGQEKQVFDLRTQLKTQRDAVTELQAKTAGAGSTPAPCKPAATAAHKKKKTTTTPAAKTGSAGSTTQKPSAATPASTQKPQ